MTQPKHLDPYTSPRTFYGAELRRLREEATWSQEQLGERVFCSGTYIGQFESATRRPQPDLSKQLDGVLGSGEHLQRLCELARKSKHPDYFADAAELEKQAQTISEYTPMLIPGLLQTEAYARGLTRATLPFAPDEVVEQHVAARLERSRRLDNPTGPELWAIVHEAALRMPVDDPKVMQDQLEQLAATARGHHRVMVQVLPFAAGPHPLMYGTAILMTFTDAPPVAYTEGAHTGQLIDDPALVAKFQRSYDLVRAAALSPKASLSLIDSAAKDYTTP
ncbi:transcriptional regulator with XRE-family HTH domain [Streptomyces sp. LBL]|uniref:helix-turn-helix domain-containing protein n=1 Tax=Streptomyces sp. LBL TaxID=2940562 RepID=UPI00247606B2|nr:helix-turn-helix transcriptional regulator [Streptomyces sp. LBL]MDH6629345.1 transcriptional regulator with XRE-family HTH domain [Streptomyces sp. LBL]